MNNPFTCYMCDRIATSDEHAPPKCIFPEQKDLPAGVNYRRNLITVPSCDEHNTAKSKDDEYLMYILPSSIGSNKAGLNHFLTKVQRAITRKPALANRLAKNPIPVTIHDTKTDVWSKAFGLEIDIERINDVIEKNARAIYFYHTHKKHLGPIDVIGNFSLKLDDVTLNSQINAVFVMAEQLLKDVVEFGDNPDVFTYRFAECDSCVLIELNFYGVNKALAYLK